MSLWLYLKIFKKNNKYTIASNKFLLIVGTKAAIVKILKCHAQRTNDLTDMHNFMKICELNSSTLLDIYKAIFTALLTHTST